MTSCTDYTEEYAECYELITQHKGYRIEVDALISFLASFNLDKRILSVGCGIGLHERYLAKYGYKVFGIDQSAGMINYALSKSDKNPNLDFGLSYNSAEQSIGLPVGFVISLFNVVNCLPDIASLRSFFEEIHSKMVPGGLFFFEAWNGVECMINPPQTVVRDFEDTNGNFLNRVARPMLYPSTQHLQIEYDIIGKMHQRLVAINSVHNIMLYTINEIKFLLSSVGFQSVNVYSSLPGLEPFDFDSTNPPRMLAFSALA